MITNTHRALVALAIASTCLSTTVRAGDSPRITKQSGHVVITTVPVGTDTAGMAVRLAEQNLLPDGTLRSFGNHAYIVAQDDDQRLDPGTNDLITRRFHLYMQDGELVAANSLIVKFRNSPTDAEALAFGSEFGLKMSKRVLQRYVVFDPARSADDLGVIAERIADHEAVENVRLDRLMNDIELRQVADEIRDPLFPLQWHLENNGQFGGFGLTGSIGAIDAWESTLGEGIRFGMFDDAVEFDHPDLVTNYLGFSDGIFGDAAPISSFETHGTAVAGLIFAAANSIGVRGVAPEARFTASSGLNYATSSDIADVFQFALNSDVDVHNNSWGLRIQGNTEEIVTDAIVEAANKGRDGLGMVIVFAAGNSNLQQKSGDDYNTLPEVISIGASALSDTRSSYSNYGQSLDVMSPSGGNGLQGLATTDRTDARGPGEISQDPDYSDGFSGTSGASPIAAGLAGLILSINDNLDRVQVMELLRHTAQQVSPDDAEYDPTESFSVFYGYGRIDAAAAVEAAQTSLNGNVTWPGPVLDVDVDIQEGVDAEGEDLEAVARIAWDPSGMPDGNGEIRTEQTNVLVVYLNPNGTATEISFKPDDGQVYDGGNPDLPLDGDMFQGGDLVVLYSGPVQTMNDGRQNVPAQLALEGGEDEPQQFAIFSANSRNRYGFGIMVNENGDRINDFDAPVNPEIPPDQGAPTNPELDPGVVGLNDPPQVATTVDNLEGTAPLTVKFFGNTVSPVEIINRGWSFGDGSSADDENIEHVYRFPGIYNAVYFAENSRHEVSTLFTQIRVLDPNGGGIGPMPNPRATIRILTPQPAAAPNATVRMTADTLNIGGGFDDEVEFFWDFGDGQSGMGQTVETIYQNAGFYQVLLRVTENGVEVADAEVSVSVLGVDSAGGPSQVIDSPNQGSGTTGQNSGACGASGVASLMLTCIGLVSLRRRRR